MNQTVIVLDFGGQYSQLIARKIRECQVYCEVLPWTAKAEEILSKNPIGLVLSGGPASVYADGAPTMDRSLLDAGIPVLGICYGCQLTVQLLGGEVRAAQAFAAREYGRTETSYDTDCPLFAGLPEKGISWMSHGDYVSRLPEGFQVSAATAHCPNTTYSAHLCPSSRRTAATAATQGVYSRLNTSSVRAEIPVMAAFTPPCCRKSTPSTDTTLSFAMKPLISDVTIRQSPSPNGTNSGVIRLAIPASMLPDGSGTGSSLKSKLWSSQTAIAATSITENALCRKSFDFSHSSCMVLRRLGSR